MSLPLANFPTSLVDIPGEINTSHDIGKDWSTITPDALIIPGSYLNRMAVETRAIELELGAGSAGNSLRGTKTNLLSRLAVSLNPDGSIKSSVGYFVSDYGAVGDGLTDDTTAIQAALNAAGAAGGGIVWLMPKSHLITGITIPAYVMLLGYGHITRLERKTGASAGSAVVTFTGGASTGYNGLSNCVVDGNKVINPSAGHGVYLRGVVEPLIRDVWIVDCGQNGLDMDKDGSNNPTSGGWFENIWVTQCTGWGISLSSGAYDNRLLGCEAGVCDAGGIVLSMASGTRMEACATYWNSGVGFRLYQTFSCSMVNCRAERNTQHGFQLDSVQDCHLHNIRAYHNSSSDNVGTGRNTYSGIYLTGTDTVQTVTGCKHVTITGRSGDTYTAGVTNLPYQKYGVEEVAGGTFSDCYYDVLVDRNATGGYSLIGGCIFSKDGDIFEFNKQLKFPTLNQYDGAFGVDSGGTRLSNGADIRWSEDATYWGTKDIGLNRSGAGVLKVNNGGTGYGTIDASDFLLSGTSLLSGVQNIFYSVEVDLTAVADYTFVLPAGSVFFVDEVGVISTQVGGAVTLEPTCRWGIVGTLAKYKAATLLTLLTAANKRERFQTLLADDGETSANSLSAGVTVGGTVAAGVYKGRFYFKGHFIEAEP